MPLDGLGLQSHFGWDLTPPERVLSILVHVEQAPSGGFERKLCLRGAPARFRGLRLRR